MSGCGMNTGLSTERMERSPIACPKWTFVSEKNEKGKSRLSDEFRRFVDKEGL